MFDTNQNSGLRVWVEPLLENDASQAEAPVTELLVTVNHYYNNTRAYLPLWNGDKSC